MSQAITVTFVTSNNSTTSLCDVKVFGDDFTEPLECLRVSTGRDYKGFLNKIDEYECVNWNTVTSPGYMFDNETFPESNADEAKNYCRVPKTAKYPHCWVNKSGTLRILACKLLECDYICRRSGHGVEYKGM